MRALCLLLVALGAGCSEPPPPRRASLPPATEEVLRRVVASEAPALFTGGSEAARLAWMSALAKARDPGRTFRVVRTDADAARVQGGEVALIPTVERLSLPAQRRLRDRMAEREIRALGGSDVRADAPELDPAFHHRLSVLVLHVPGLDAVDGPAKELARWASADR